VVPTLARSDGSGAVLRWRARLARRVLRVAVDPAAPRSRSTGSRKAGLQRRGGAAGRAYARGAGTRRPGALPQVCRRDPPDLRGASASLLPGAARRRRPRQARTPHACAASCCARWRCATPTTLARWTLPRSWPRLTTSARNSTSWRWGETRYPPNRRLLNHSPSSVRICSLRAAARRVSHQLARRAGHPPRRGDPQELGW
jgi:hypothetical protein